MKRIFGFLFGAQTNVLSAAFVIMGTVMLSFLFGFIRERLLISYFGASNTLGIFFYSTLIPETLFQLTIAAALNSAFIPVFSDYLHKGREKEGQKMASTLLVFGLVIFAVLSIVIFMFGGFFLQMFNISGYFSPKQMELMLVLMRIALAGQLLFIVGSFFSTLLQAYSRFLIPGIAATLYNFGIIISIIFFAGSLGIYSAAVGIVVGSLLFVLLQLPYARQIGFAFRPQVSAIVSEGVVRVGKLMWPRTLSIVIFQIGSLALASLISYLADPGRMNVIYNYAKTLSYAPVVLVGNSVAQAAFPLLSRQKDDRGDFKTTFTTSFNQVLYFILPIAVLLLVLRIPVVRLVWGAATFDWSATVLTGRTLAYLSVSIVAQALIMLVLRGFYALHNTVVPLVVGAITTTIMIVAAYVFIVWLHLDVVAIAAAYSFASILQLLVCLYFLDRRIGGFGKREFFVTCMKFFFATAFMGIALYVPLRLLDQLVFDTTRTINLLFLTGISSGVGLSLYLFLTWLFNMREAVTFLMFVKKVGDFRQSMGKSEEAIDSTRFNT